MSKRSSPKFHLIDHWKKIRVRVHINNFFYSVDISEEGIEQLRWKFSKYSAHMNIAN